MMLERYPLKHSHKIIEKSHEDVEYLFLTINNKNDREKNINISTYGIELTVFIGKHHRHFDSFASDDHEQEFKDLIEHIYDIINDDVYFAVGYKGTNASYYTATYNFSDLQDETVDRVEITSWSGKFDQIIENKG